MYFIHRGGLCCTMCEVHKTKHGGAYAPPCQRQPNGGLIFLFGPFGCFGLLILANLQTLHEAIYLTSSVEQALLARIKRVAFRTNIKAQRFFGRYGWPSAPTTSTRIYCFMGFWMNSLLHRMLLTVRPRWRTR